MSTGPKVKHFKILIIGESGVGKSSLMLKYVDDIFTGYYINTIGVDFKARNIQIGDYTCKTQIWDTAGQERFRVITSTGADGVIVVYDVTSRSSFEKVEKWMEEIQNFCVNDKVARILVGNKDDFDVGYKKVVQTEEASDYATSLNIPFFETSAKDGKNVNELLPIECKNSAESHGSPSSKTDLGDDGTIESATLLNDKSTIFYAVTKLALELQNGKQKTGEPVVTLKKERTKKKCC